MGYQSASNNFVAGYSLTGVVSETVPEYLLVVSEAEILGLILGVILRWGYSGLRIAPIALCCVDGYSY